MIVAPRKRSRQDAAAAPAAAARRRVAVKFEDVRVFLVERKMGRSRRSFLTQLATSKGFLVTPDLSDAVTHVVSEERQAAALWAWLRERGPKNLPSMHVVDVSWFTDSMREGRPVAVETRHLIQEVPPSPPPDAAVTAVSPFACQRRTTIDNKNTKFTDALEVLAERYEFNECDGPCLAFRRAASVLKSLPRAVHNMADVLHLPWLGGHARAVVQEILVCGRSSDVERTVSDERYRTLKLFTSVFGVGPKTADKWHRAGLRSFADVFADRTVKLNRMQETGFLHYRDISGPVSRAESRAITTLMEDAVHAVSPDAILALTGGFRRGKEFGHDVDFIVTTPEPGEEQRLLTDIIDELKDRGVLLYVDFHPSTLDEAELPCQRFEAMDRYAKSFLILRLEAWRLEAGRLEAGRLEAPRLEAPRLEAGRLEAGRLEATRLEATRLEAGRLDGGLEAPRLEAGRLDGGLHCEQGDERGWRLEVRGWRAVRVDLVSPPRDRTAYAMLGWTGSRQFERDLRRFAQLKRRMCLDNHGLYHKDKRQFLAADTEEDVFVHLGLDYLEPWQRNA